MKPFIIPFCDLSFSKFKSMNWFSRYSKVLIAASFASVALMISLGVVVAQNVPETSTNTITIEDAVVKLIEAVEVPVEQAGVLAELNIREGSIVKQNQILGRMKDAELKIQVERAKLQLQMAKLTAESRVDIEYAKKSFEVAAAEVNRSEQANQRVANSIPLSRVEKQRLERERTRLQLQQAERDFRVVDLQAKLSEVDVRLTQAALDKTEIRAPSSGMIVSVNSEAGEWVQPGQTLAKIVAIDRLRLEGFVSAEQSLRLKSGAAVTVNFPTAWSPHPLPGKIAFIHPEANPVNLNVSVWIEIENPNRKLMPGLRGQIEIQIGD